MQINLFNPGFSINKSGNLSLRDIDLAKLSELSLERPLYVIDEVQIRKNISDFQNSLSKHYPAPSKIFYACKALQNIGLCALMKKLEIGLDVCSYGEIMVAEMANSLFSDMIFHGNNKSRRELEYAIRSKIHYIIIDNESELKLINDICTKHHLKCSVLLRVNPDITVHTHKYIATGVTDSKFGMMCNNDTIDFIKQIISNPHIDFAGIHSHIGSQITDPSDMIEATDELVDYIYQMKQEDINCEVLNIGGGIGIKYQPTDMVEEISYFMKPILENLVTKLEARDLLLPYLMIEPGRAIIGNAGCTIYKIGTIKEGSDGFLYAAVNGGMTDNIRTALYQASYFAAIVNDATRTGSRLKYKIVGKCCESGDILINEIILPELREGDSLVIFCTGAYNASMASNFNKHNFPGMVLINEGRYDWLVKEQPIEDLAKYDLVPEHLR